MLPLCCSMVASMAWTMLCFYRLNYAFAYACLYVTSLGQYTWYLAPCNGALTHIPVLAAKPTLNPTARDLGVTSMLSELLSDLSSTEGGGIVGVGAGGCVSVGGDHASERFLVRLVGLRSAFPLCLP
jgi:hypothetical protein